MRFFPLILRNLLRRPVATILTGLAAAATVFIFASLLSLDRGMERMLASTAHDEVITVFERHKACPPYSALPSHYQSEVAGVDGVEEVMGVRFLLSNCQTTTDLVAVHGVEPDKFRRFEPVDVVDGSYEAFEAERSAALVGSRIAARYGWAVGDQVVLEQLGGVPFVIRGIFDAPGSTLEEIVVVDREYLEYTIDEVGVVTMFRVLVSGEADIGAVSAAIDDGFANRSKPTRSGPEREFIADLIDDFTAILHFSQGIAYLSLVLLFVVLANSMSISVRDRTAEWATMRTLGYSRRLVAGLIVAEAVALSTAAAAVGTAGAAAVLWTTGFTISVEGYTIAPHLSARVVFRSMFAGAVLGVVGAVPAAIRSVRHPIVDGLGGADA